MIRRPAIAFGLLGAAFLGGCADLMQRSTFAPEWFQAKAVEVKGEGYPELKDIPGSRGPTGGAPEWEGEAAALRNAGAALEAKAAEGGPIPTEEELRAREAEARARLDGVPPAQ
jgi:hypothetical protein